MLKCCILNQQSAFFALSKGNRIELNMLTEYSRTEQESTPWNPTTATAVSTFSTTFTQVIQRMQMDCVINIFALILSEVNKSCQLDESNIQAHLKLTRWTSQFQAFKSCTPVTGDILRKRWNATSSKQFQVAIVWKSLLKKRVGWLLLDFLPTETEIKIDICYLFLWCAEFVSTLCVFFEASSAILGNTLPDRMDFLLHRF